MAEGVGISESSLGRIWRTHGLKPHRVSRFKLSNDKQFQDKLEDVVGLYLAPPENIRGLPGKSFSWPPTTSRQLFCYKPRLYFYRCRRPAA